MFRNLLLPALILVFTFSIFSQATDPKKTEEDQKKLEKDVIEFLRETSVDINSMRSLENRISFNSELASLMWFHDEKEAKAMYGGVVSDFKQLLTQFDSQMNSLTVPGDDDSFSSGGLFGGYGKSPVERKFRIAMAVRQQIAMSLAEHAPDLAYNFFYDSLSLISNPQFRKETEQSDKYFEYQLMKQIADSNPAKATEYGKESIKNGLETSHIELLKTIYAKDTDKGIEFGAAILSRLKSDKSRVKGPYVYNSLLAFGSVNLEGSKKAGGTKAIYSVNDLRDIADQFAQVILEADNAAIPSASGYADLIDKFAPGRGAQIRAKFKVSRVANTSGYPYGSATNRTFNSSNSVAYPGYGSNMSSNSNTSASRAVEAREKIEKQMMEDVKNLGTRSLPKEERDKIVAQARKIISQTPGKDKKIIALSLLATQVAHAGDRELADEIMRDAERLVNPQPKNYQEFLYSWMLAGGYAEVNPDKAFPILESTILRANETLAAFVKVAEFMDVNAEFVDDGEVQVGMFGGSMIRSLTAELGMANSTIRSLVKADFVKTKNLTNTFDRTEIRILAKMMVLRAVLDTRTPTEINKALSTDVGFEDTELPPPPKPRSTPH